MKKREKEKEKTKPNQDKPIQTMEGKMEKVIFEVKRENGSIQELSLDRRGNTMDMMRILKSVEKNIPDGVEVTRVTPTHKSCVAWRGANGRWACMGSMICL